MLGGMRHTLLALTLTLLAVTPALAQSGGTAVAITNTPVYVAPDASRTPLRIAAQGTVFTVVAEQGEWTQVQFKDPQWGIRVGYVATKALQFRRPELEPMDLSTAAEPATRYAPPVPAGPSSRAVPPPPRSSRSYVIGRGGFTFGTRVAPLVGAEFGGQVAPLLQVYGSFDWHRDVAPTYLRDLAELISELTDVDVDARLPAYVAMSGVKVTAPRGVVRPYGLGGFGFARVEGRIEVEGDDVTGLLDELGAIDRDDLEFNKPLFEVGGGIAISKASLHVDVSYRFRKFLDTGEPVNVSGIYAGVGVGF
jgi:opacity protein-like surface antigen